MLFNAIIIDYFCRNGSVVNTMKLQFLSVSVPNITEIGKVLINAATNVTDFHIETSSIIIKGIRKKQCYILKTSV